MLIALLLYVSFLSVLVPASSTGAQEGMTADYVRVVKSKRTLYLYRKEEVIKKYRVALGRNPVGPKLRRGDGRTPEGRYIIDGRKADSKYHRALHISYPNEIDRQVMEIAGEDPGGGIYIHGTGKEYEWMGKFHSVNDWTEGCIAVTNEEIEEIWDLVPDGTPIEIVP